MSPHLENNMSINSNASDLRPVDKLIGRTLENGWTVEEYVNRMPNATGGHFSVGYLVRNASGDRAFLKAIDFSGALHSEDPAREMQRLTETFNFERDLLERCRKKRLDRVVTGLEEGKVFIDSLPVPYLIFEMAERDMRAHLDLSDSIDLASTIRLLHHVSVGLKQLHGMNIAHQDLKPSNVLVFERFVSKLADLGRSAHPDFSPPHNDFVVPGGIPYAPPELRYQYVDPDFRRRRIGADLFLLGNIVLFAFARQTMSSAIYSFTEPEHRPDQWTGTFAEVIPFLQLAFNLAIAEVSNEIPQEVRRDITELLRWLCEPDPARRGHPQSRNNQSLERIISRLDLLAHRTRNCIFDRD